MTTQPHASSTYVIDDRANQYDRLVRIAQAHDDNVQDGCRRAGLRSGSHAIDVGCGPLGALLSLGNLVGASGSVVGLDMNAQALETAGMIVSQHGLGNVQFVRGDINSMALNDIPGRARSISHIAACSWSTSPIRPPRCAGWASW